MSEEQAKPARARYSRKLKEFEFDLEPENWDGDDATLEKYVLKEMKGKERDRYLAAINSRMRGSPGTANVKITSFDGIQADLLAKCIFKVQEDNTHRTITVDQLQEWPSSLQQELHDKAQEMCGLTEGADLEAEAKNA
jgi:hypothetical protein